MSAEKDWKQLSSYAHTRLRTEVFFGSRDAHTQTVLEYAATGAAIVETTWVPAVFTILREILENALDEVVFHQHGDRIDVVYDPIEMILSVTDNGRGIPIDWSEEHQKYAATVLLSEMNSGRNFIEQRGETRGLNGIGAKGVNYCSEWFTVEVTRGKQRFVQQFHEGDELQVGDPVLTPATAKKTGTRIKCKLSKQVFPDLRLPERFVAARMHEIAFCYPALHLTYNGTRVIAKSPFGSKAPILFTIDEPEVRAKFWLVPDFVQDSEFVFSLVNAIPLFNGGTHIDAFRKNFHSGLLTVLERESKRRKLLPNRSDVSDGLLIYCTLEMAAPSFDSQSKTRLINESIGTLVRKVLDNPEFFKGIIKAHPAWIESIYQRCADRTRVKDDKDVKKAAKKNLRQKIEDLEDACGVDRRQCVLMLCEGKSAVAGCAEARDPQIHACLPLRGKIPNVHGESFHKVLGNEPLSKMMSAIGLVPGVRVNRHAIRYGKVYITTDSDEDGKSIAALIICFFYTYWPELFDPEKPPFIFIFNTPLIIAVRGKTRRYWYNDNLANFDPTTLKGWEIVRAKGLAALERPDWKNALDNPKLTPIIDDGRLKESLDLLYNPSKADLRKRWIGM